MGRKQRAQEYRWIFAPRSVRQVRWKKRHVCAAASAAIADAFGGLFAGAGGSKMTRGDHAKLGVALTCVALSGTPAWACGWWDCRDGFSYRKQAPAYGYYSPGPRSGASGRMTTRTGVWGAPPNINANAGLPAPGSLSYAGVMDSPMPGRGPSLFGPASGTSYTYTSVRQGSRPYRRSVLQPRWRLLKRAHFAPDRW